MALPINIEALLGGNVVENDRIEFKEGWNPDSIYRSICAFANDFEDNGSGYIVVGVKEENGRPVRPVTGVPINQIDKIEKEVVGFNNFFQPFYMPRVYIEDVDEKKVIVFWVMAGERRPYKIPECVTAKHKTYKSFIRYSSSSIEAKGENELELIERANRVPFDDRGNITARVNDVSMLLIREFLNQTHSKMLDQIENAAPMDILDQMGLLSGPKEDIRVKNVALMMFAYHPEKFFPGTQVDIVIYPKGKDDDPDNFIEVDPIKGPVNIIIQKTLDYLRTMVIRQRVKKISTQAEAIRTYNYPYQALEEAVVNALYHRSYQEREPVEISVLPDQIEIISYGGADRSISLEALRSGKRIHARRYRNSLLGSYLKELGLTEGRGTGLPTIHRELEQNGSPEAYIETDADRTYFLISIPCRKDMVAKELVIKEDGRVVDADYVEADYPSLADNDVREAIEKINKLFGINILAELQAAYQAGDQATYQAGLVTGLAAGLQGNDRAVSQAMSQAISQAISQAGSQAGSQTGSQAGLVMRMLCLLREKDFSSRDLMDSIRLTYNKYNRKKYIAQLVDAGIIAWDHNLKKQSPKQTLHLTDLGKAVLACIEKGRET